jgi:hypothetical protein
MYYFILVKWLLETEHPKDKKEALGEVLNGDRLVDAPYELNFKEDKNSKILCKKTLTKEQVRMQLPRTTTSRCTMMTCHCGDSFTNWIRTGSRGCQILCYIFYCYVYGDAKYYAAFSIVMYMLYFLYVGFWRLPSRWGGRQDMQFF